VNRSLRLLLMILMIAGFTAGFAGLVLPGQTALLETPRQGIHQFQRLHIFLFNLVAGGTILLWFAEGRRRLSPRVLIYLVLSLAFSVAAFLDHYATAIGLAAALGLVVESLRVRLYGVFPADFFRRGGGLAERYLHAALLCLSLGLFICAGVMVNNGYLHRFAFLDLLLDDFFLGFSFPLSLLTFAVMFALMGEPRGAVDRFLRDSSFWVVTVGVIVFFVFIILDWKTAEVLTSLFLLGDVLVLYALFRRDSVDLEQNAFLMSGMAFLAFTSFTGVMILLWGSPYVGGSAGGRELLLQIHGYLSLYGWNLAGLAVVVRYEEFPLRLNDVEIILLHWATVALLAPLGTLYPAFALLALPAFIPLLILLFFARGRTHVASRRRDPAAPTGVFWRELD